MWVLLAKPVKFLQHSSEDAEFLCNIFDGVYTKQVSFRFFDLGLSFYIADLRNYDKTATFE